ncbi:aromatic ring-opening dioxygenase LigA [Oerskovia sp. Sa1BUA8]|uniref:Aromatic ring-opening dioxygenase LigA n=1 Tax=Oerskovia douganii TaxID=2762210 RepID=A0A9D5UA89_9CELL|nr:aromatic ring-opening dioxygenase LigA [Oerskovia douganii]MBE7701388.1 aromatic ring-opening dioxygenase LigA [Oerskovia douganii]
MTARTAGPARSVRLIGTLSIVAGIVLLLAGAGTWATITSQLAAEKITVSEDASMFAGSEVKGPFTAFAQAQIINEHALNMSEGKTYAELDKEDPTRAVVMNGSFLRASLFTSVVSYGVSALVMGLGVLFGLIGYALRQLGAAPAVVDGSTNPTPEVVNA